MQQTASARNNSVGVGRSLKLANQQRKIGDRMDAQFGKDRASMGSHRQWANGELAGDMLGRFSFGDQQRNRLLSFGQQMPCRTSFEC